MNKILCYLGVVIVLIGAVILMMYYFGVFSSNSALATSAVFMVAGTIVYTILNKYFREE